MAIEMTKFNKLNNNKFDYLIGKSFISDLFRATIKGIIINENENNIDIYIKQNVITYKHNFRSIMQLFDYYYNRGFVLEI